MIGDSMEIDINKLSKYKLLDYDRELRKFIISFVDKYYPLSQEDLAAVFDNRDTNQTLIRRHIRNILMEIKNEVIREELAIRKDDETESYKDEDMDAQIKKSLEFKKQMIEKLKQNYNFKQGMKM